MKILIFSLVYYPRFIGGAEVAIKEITDRLDENEYHMITLRLDKRLPKVEKVGNILVHRIGFAGECKDSSDSLRFPLHLNKYLFIPLGFIKAFSLYRKNKYDLIWSMMATYNSFAAVLFKIFKPKVKFLLTLQEGDPIDYIKKRARPLWPLFKMIFTKADHIQVISNFLADFSKDMGYEKEISLVPNGVDFDFFAKRDEDKISDIKNKYNKGENIWIITTSRLVTKNAIGDVINSLPLLSKNISFLILGEGYQKKELEERVDVMGLKDRVHFLGYVPHKEMPVYLQASDIFIRPSLSEGFGNSFIESMATGIPVLATEVGGIVDFIKHKKTGLFVGVKDPQDIALKIEMLLKDVELREEIVENAREMVREKYDWDIVSEQMREVFDKLK